MNDERHDHPDIELLESMVGIFQALVDAGDRWPEVSALALEAESDGDLVERLRELLGIDEEQAGAVLNMQVRRLSKLNRERMRSELEERTAELACARRDRDAE